MTENLWRRTMSAVGKRYRRSALAQYGAGLDCDCEDDTAASEDIAVPLPRPAADGRVLPAAGASTQAAQVS